MIDFLLNNIVFVVVVVFGIFRLLSSASKGANQNEQRDTPQEAQTTLPQQQQQRSESGTSELFGELKDLFKEITDTTEETTERKVTQAKRNVANKAEVASSKTMQTATETHEEQMDKWRKRYAKPTEKKRVEHQLVGDLSGPIEVTGKYSSGVEDTDVRKHLTRRGLQESFVMAEILGSPRAFKPHQSSYRRRNI